jgi:hypothetical protein
MNLVGLRRVFLHTAAMLVEISIAISAVFEGTPGDAAWPWLVLAVGTAGSVGGLIWTSRFRWRASREQLRSAGSVARFFRSLMFIRLCLAASPALYGVVGAEIGTGPTAPSLGTVVSLMLLASFGPTRSRVDDVQARLREHGSPISLRLALNETP